MKNRCENEYLLVFWSSLKFNIKLWNGLLSTFALTIVTKCSDLNITKIVPRYSLMTHGIIFWGTYSRSKNFLSLKNEGVSSFFSIRTRGWEEGLSKRNWTLFHFGKYNLKICLWQIIFNYSQPVHMGTILLKFVKFIVLRIVCILYI